MLFIDTMYYLSKWCFKFEIKCLNFQLLSKGKETSKDGYICQLDWNNKSSLEYLKIKSNLLKFSLMILQLFYLISICFNCKS